MSLRCFVVGVNSVFVTKVDIYSRPNQVGRVSICVCSESKFELHTRGAAAIGLAPHDRPVVPPKVPHVLPNQAKSLTLQRSGMSGGH